MKIAALFLCKSLDPRGLSSKLRNDANRSRGFLLGVLALFLWSAALSPRLAQADAEPLFMKPLQIELDWITLGGGVVHLDWPAQTRWIWKKQTLAEGQLGPGEIPVLRTWVEFPKELTLTGVEGGNAVATQAPDDSPFSDRERVWAFDIQSPSGQITLDFLDSRNQHHTSLGLVVRTLSDRPTLMVNSTCTEQGISLRSRDYRGSHFFVGLYCQRTLDKVDLYIIRSDEAEWKESSFTSELVTGPDWYGVRVPVPSVEAGVLGNFTVGLPKNSGDPRTTTYYVVFQQPSAEFTTSRFGKSAELATSYLNYKDDAITQHLVEYVLTGKVSGSYAIVPQKLDIAINGFITLVPLITTPSQPSVRWYGINGRLAYRLPLDIPATSIQVMSGWYFWGMIVPTQEGFNEPTFGVSSLGGPQLLLRLRRAPVGKHPWAIYTKYAIIQSDPTSLGLSNRELAMGGSYQLSPPAETKPFNLNMDISQAHFDGVVSGSPVPRDFNFLSFSIGVSKVF